MPKVTIYGTTHCPKCQMIKKFFEMGNVDFTFVNLDEQPDLMSSVAENVWPSTSLPILECNNKFACVANATEALDFVQGDKEEA